MGNFELRKKAMSDMMKNAGPIEIKKKEMVESQDEPGSEKKSPFLVTEAEKQMILDMRKEESGESKEEEGSESEPEEE